MTKITPPSPSPELWGTGSSGIVFYMDIDREIAIAHSAANRAHDAAHTARRAGDLARITKTEAAARRAQDRVLALRQQAEQCVECNGKGHTSKQAVCGNCDGTGRI